MLTTIELTEKRNRFTALALEAKPLAERSNAGELTADENTRFDTIVAEMRDIQAAIDETNTEREAQRTRAAEFARLNDLAAETGGRVSDDGTSVAIPQSRARNVVNVGRRFAQSEGFKRYSKQAAGHSERSEFGSTYHQRDAHGEWEERALVYGTAFAGYIQPNRLPGIVAGTPFPLRVRDVLSNGRTDSPNIEFVVEGPMTNNAGWVAEATSVGGAATKPESDILLTVQTTSVKTVAHAIPVTRQMLEDAAQIETYINTKLLYGLAKKEDDAFINGAGGAAITGILQTSNVQHLNSAYWAIAGNKLSADANVLDAVLRGIKQSQLVGEANPSFIAANPDDYEAWRTIKDANGNYLLRGGGPEAGGIPTLWGLPVVQTKSVQATKPLVGDGHYAIVFDKTDGQIYMTDSHSDWFLKNLFAILAEARLALAVTLPAAFVEVETATAMANRLP